MINDPRIGKLDLNNDPYEFALVAMIERSLLSTVTGSVLAGLLDEKGEGSEESDRGDVGTRFRRRKEFRVFVEESGHRFVMALAEEIGFADGLVGERRVEGERGRRQECSSDKNCSDGAGREGHGCSLLWIRRINALERLPV